jgi:hypothetical protein
MIDEVVHGYRDVGNRIMSEWVKLGVIPLYLSGISYMRKCDICGRVVGKWDIRKADVVHPQR